MLKTLFRKQMLELNRNFFYDEKKGKARSKSASTVSILLFVFLMVGVIGGIFIYMAKTISPLIEGNMGWMYFLIMGSVAVMLGIFGSVFNTYASLYQAKDNDLILSMPIPVRIILIVRLSGVYLMGAMYSLIVFIPAMIIYYITAGVTAAGIAGTVISALLITIFVFVLSCMLGWLVARISGKLKNKSLVTVLVSIAFIVVYYFVYFRANEMINSLLENAIKTGSTIKLKAQPLYIAGCAAQGDVKSLLIVSAVVLVLLVVTVLVLSRTFLSIATSSSNEKKAVYKEKKVKCKSISGALYSREMKHFLASPVYMLNCALGTLFIMIAAVAVLWKGRWVEDIFVFGMGMPGEMLFVILVGAICLMTTMNTITAPSISLEGRNLWIVQSLPVPAWQVLCSKLYVHLILTSVPTLICSICTCIALKPGIIMSLFLFVTPQIFVLFEAMFGLAMNLKQPNLNWTSETAVVKQSFCLLAVLFGGWGIIILLVIAFILLHEYINTYLFMLLCTVLFVVLSVVLYRWLKNRGVKLFEKL